MTNQDCSGEQNRAAGHHEKDSPDILPTLSQATVVPGKTHQLSRQRTVRKAAQNCSQILCAGSEGNCVYPKQGLALLHREVLMTWSPESLQKDQGDC